MGIQQETNYKISAKLWAVIEPLIPGTKGKWGGISSDNKDFVETILGLIFNKDPFSAGLSWKGLDTKKRANYNRRFTNWRNNGTWESLLPTLIKYEECYWLAEPCMYEVLLKNHKLISLLNQTYILTCEDSIYYEDYRKERLAKEYPHFMKNFKRRRTSAAKRGLKQPPRGAYMKKYSDEEKEQFHDFEL